MHEKVPELKLNKDFGVGYSPERINLEIGQEQYQILSKSQAVVICKQVSELILFIKR